MQMRLIQRLTKAHHNLAVVGDDDQSIYGWRGACVANILDFPKLYPACQVVRLERNYRSTPSILNLANAVIATNSDRHKKVLIPRDGIEAGTLPELFVYETETEEAESVASEIAELVRRGATKRDIAVLYRSNSQGALLEAELRRLNVPYLMSGGTAFFDRKEIRDVLAYLRCAVKPNEIAFRRILNTPPRGIGEKSVDTFNTFSIARKIPFPEAARRWRDAGVDERCGGAVEILFHFLSDFSARLVEPGPPTTGERLLAILQEIGYRAHLEKMAGSGLVATKRWRWLETFAGILDRYLGEQGRTRARLVEFLDAMELRDHIDEEQGKKDTVQLLTLHACKGLEFPIVFLLGVEEDLLPHRTLGNDIAEERRLFYVGVTRAQERLILTRADQRRRHGRTVKSPPSRFLVELPKTLYKEFRGSRPIEEGTRKSLLADLFKKLDALDAPVPKTS